MSKAKRYDEDYGELEEGDIVSRGKLFRPKAGLEGPFRYRSGIVLYYDPKEGKYYDSLCDLYLDYETFEAMTR